jgi:hypothetical protein
MLEGARKKEEKNAKNHACKSEKPTCNRPGGDHGNPDGRPKGSVNKFTNLKKAFLEVFERLGGVEGLYDWVAENKFNKRLFYQWITKMLPSSLVGEQDEKGEFKPLQVFINTNGDEPPDGNNTPQVSG